jgi:hypothetical protein
MPKRKLKTASCRLPCVRALCCRITIWPALTGAPTAGTLRVFGPACTDFSDLFVPPGANPSEVDDLPMPLVWLAQVVALHLHQEHHPEVVQVHFSIILASIMTI